MMSMSCERTKEQMDLCFFDIPPPDIDEKLEYNHVNDAKYKHINRKNIHKTDCLKDVIIQAIPHWESDILPSLKQCDITKYFFLCHHMRSFASFFFNVKFFNLTLYKSLFTCKTIAAHGNIIREF
ncbi:phosphoglycerate mutase [Reticulomyxa filosa]|uniref:Phosphoglycerate mutase n=1 Tax=Reticulomyxa filosa TaxID=46433 RepID=X6PFH4_RETFI|nr:phosphoglycerate mutase [Reticulomyxa filosa]|eukprot:ETO36951.1 phosphoglycerate mutase [Reticulomyxa filosa]